MVGQEINYEFNISEQMVKILSHNNEFVFVKNINKQYLNCNQNYATALGYNSPSDIMGLTDSQINPLHKNIYALDDNKVLLGEEIKIDNPAYFKGTGIVNVSGVIMPLEDQQGKISFIVGATNLKNSLINKSLSSALLLLNEDNIDQITNKNSYQVNTKFGIAKLSKRETQCVLLLLKSYSAKDIAKCLNIAPKSVESYFVNIKNKIHADSKSNIIDIILEGKLLEQL